MGDKTMILGMTRLQRHHLPGTPSPCPKVGCVYNVEGVCDQPQVNKGNGDAKCHRWTNRRVLEMLSVQRPEGEGNA